MIVEISSHKRAAVRFLFDNGNEVSIVWGGGTYSENHDDYTEILPPGIESDEAYEAMRLLQPPDKPPTRYGDTVSSRTVEIMVTGHIKFVEWFEAQYDQNPAGYVDTKEIPLILAHADSRKYKVKE